MSRTPGVVTLVVSAWLSGLVLAARPLGFESPVAPRHPSAPMPRFEPPSSLCEPRFAGAGCDIREDVVPEEGTALDAGLRAHAEAVARWQSERRPALLTAVFWRAPWPWFAVVWTALALALARLTVRAHRRARALHAS